MPDLFNMPQLRDPLSEGKPFGDTLGPLIYDWLARMGEYGPSYREDQMLPLDMAPELGAIREQVKPLGQDLQGQDVAPDTQPYIPMERDASDGEYQEAANAKRQATQARPRVAPSNDVQPRKLTPYEQREEQLDREYYNPTEINPDDPRFHRDYPGGAVRVPPDTMQDSRRFLRRPYTGDETTTRIESDRDIREREFEKKRLPLSQEFLNMQPGTSGFNRARFEDLLAQLNAMRPQDSVLHRAERRFDAHVNAKSDADTILTAIMKGQALRGGQ